MQLYSGSSNQALVAQIGQVGGWQVGQTEISCFENDELRVRVLEKHVEARVALLQSLSAPVNSNLVEFCLLADALTRRGASEITAIVPWLGYSKQDKVFLPGESLAAKVIAQILQTARIKRLVTFDLHNRAITGFFDIPVVELSAKSLFLDYFKNKLSDQSAVISDQKVHDYVVVAPDEGAVKASGAFARELGVPIVYMDKRRDLTTGEVQVTGMSGDVQGKEVLIVDDMIATGGTAMTVAAYLKERGAQRVTIAATHHLYVPGAQEKLEASAIDEVVVTDTVSEMYTNMQMHTNAHQWAKLTVLSVAQTIVDEVE